MAQHTHKFEIKVDGNVLPEHVDQAVLNVVVESSANAPDMFAITIRDPGREMLKEAQVKIGSKVQVSVFSDATPAGERLITGEVTALEAELDADMTATVVRGLDQSHRLFGGRVTETYKNVTYSDIARKVATRSNLVIGTIDSTTTVFPHVSQGNVTDWRFLSGLAREVGFQVGVFDGKFEFRRPTRSTEGPDSGSFESEDPLQLVLGQELLRFRVTVTSAEQVGEVNVRGWDMRQKREIVGVATGTTESAALGTSPAQLGREFGDRRYVGVDVPYEQQAEVDAAAMALADQIASGFAEFEGVAKGSPKFRAGKALSMSLLGAPFDGKYTITTARHVYDRHDGYQVWFTVSGHHDRSLYGLAAGGSGSNGAGGSHPIHGVVPALVTDVKDPEDLGRVRLRFPWLSDTYESDWARTVQLGAGKQRGAVMLPEVSDEVLVAFDHGDLRRPYVIGGLHNGIDKPKLGEGLIDGIGAVRRRGFISKTGGGLVFLDDDAKQGVALFSGDKGLRIALNRTGTTIKVDSTGKVEINAATEVRVKAGTTLSLTAGASMEIEAPTIAIRADGPVEVKGTPIKLN